MTSATIWAAAIRALAGAGVSFMGTMFITFQVLPETMRRADRWESAAVAGGVAAAMALGFRGGVEGGYDGWRQANNKETQADVKAQPQK